VNPICTYRFASAARDIDQNTPQQGSQLHGRSARVCAPYDNAITTHVRTYIVARSHVFRICLIDTQYRASSLFLRHERSSRQSGSPFYGAAGSAVVNFSPVILHHREQSVHTQQVTTETRYFFHPGRKTKCSTPLVSDLI
jgi:hypothetical protein